VRVDPCAQPGVLAVTGLIAGSRPEGERREKLGPDVIQWSEGTIPDPSLPRLPLVFRIVRSYRVLKQAELTLSLMPGRVESETARVEQLDGAGTSLPVHVVRTAGRDTFQVIAYLYAYGVEPVRNPFVAQLSGALRELRAGRRPLTVFLAGGVASTPIVAHREALALDWIRAAWQHFDGLCSERPRGAAAAASEEPGR
jgi:hypothetical protein